MNNIDCIIAVLRSHREARAWTDEAVALDLLAQLGLDFDGDAKNARPAADPSLMTEEEVQAHETAAKQAADKAKEAREKLTAQAQQDGQQPAQPAQNAVHPSSDPLDLAPATLDANMPRVPAPDPAMLESKPGEDTDDDKTTEAKTRSKRS